MKCMCARLTLHTSRGPLRILECVYIWHVELYIQDKAQDKERVGILPSLTAPLWFHVI